MPIVNRRSGRPVRFRGMADGNILNPGGVVTGSDAATAAIQAWVCRNFPNTPGCADILAGLQASKPPVLKPGSVSPGLPVGYDPSTGAVIDNATGATQVNPYGATLPDSGGASVTTCGDGTFSGWLCCNMGIGCGSGQGTPGWVWAVGATLIGVILLGGRR
jgi:hypothetical protein